jgi:DNA-binding PadR family transcriptional regulator
MHLDSGEKVAGYPILEVRNNLAFLNGDDTFERADVRRAMPGSQKSITELIAELLKRGWIVSEQKEYRFTEEGKRFLVAHARKPITRATADRLVRFVLARVDEVNRGPYAFAVAKVEVFGSYLSDKQYLGDLDLFITLTPRFENAKEQEKKEQLRRRGCPNRLFIAQLYWPEQEVMRAIRKRNSAISLHTPKANAAIYAVVERRTLYLREA